MIARLAPLALIAVLGCRNEYTWNDQVEPEPLENDHGQWLSMDVAPEKSLVVAYYDRTRTGLGFAIGKPRGDGTVDWVHERVDGYPDSQGLDPGDRGLFASMKVAPDGTVWIAYHNKNNGALMVAHRLGPKDWTTEIVDAGSGLTPQTGLWNSLAIDDDGNPVIAYHDAGKGNLVISRRADGEWSTEVAYEGTAFTGTDAEGNPIEREPAAGQFARLHILGNTEYIAFYDGAHQDLHLLEGFSGAYAHSVVHDEGDVGQWPSIWTDGNETLVAFHDVGNQDLMLARREGGAAWTVQIVDDGEFVGADTEVFKRDGTTSIVYFDGHDNDMMLATDTGTGWIVEQLGGEEGAVGFHNEVVQRDGTWWVASYDFTRRAIHTLPLQ